MMPLMTAVIVAAWAVVVVIRLSQVIRHPAFIDWRFEVPILAALGAAVALEAAGRGALSLVSAISVAILSALDHFALRRRYPR